MCENDTHCGTVCKFTKISMQHAVYSIIVVLADDECRMKNDAGCIIDVQEHLPGGPAKCVFILHLRV